MRFVRIAAASAVIAALPSLAAAAPSAQPASGATLPPFEFESPLRNPLQEEFLAPRGDARGGAAPAPAPAPTAGGAATGAPLAAPRRSSPIPALTGPAAGPAAGPSAPAPAAAYGPATARLTGRHTILCPSNPQTEAAVRDIIPAPANVVVNPEGALNVQGAPTDGRPAVNVVIPPGTGCLLVLQDVR